MPKRTLLAISLLLPALQFPLAGQASDARSVRDETRAWRLRNEHAVLRELVELLRIPNVARDQADIRRNAVLLMTMLERRGFASRLLEAPGASPAVFGDLRVPGATRTIVYYAHYDGQPVDTARWHGDPWAPLLRDGPVEAGGREVPWPAEGAAFDPEWRLFARSASDDKSPIVALLAALDALRAAGRRPSVNLKVFLEGEEEAGSPRLGDLLRAHRDLLRADAWIFGDGPVHQTRRPQLVLGARGVTVMRVTVYGPLRPLHSGHYGNWAPNPALLLAHLVASLRDPDGRILVDGFYDDVRPPTAAELSAVAALPAVDDGLRQELALAATEAGGAPVAERVLLPALNVQSLEAGGSGPNAANAIPTQASASIDFRLVPDQTPERIRERVEAYLARRGWTVVHEAPDTLVRRRTPRLVRLSWVAGGYPATRTAVDAPVTQAVARALAPALDQPLLIVPTSGGSLPLFHFQEVLGAPLITVPIVNHDNNQHGADENLRLRNMWDGIELYAVLLARLGVEWNAVP